MENRAREEKPFKLAKGLLASRSLIQAIVFLCEIKEEACDSGVVGDELMVEISETKEGSYILDFS